MLAGVTHKDLQTVNWGLDLCAPFGCGVASLVPPLFERYARIFHPAMQISNLIPHAIPWQHVAYHTNRKVHALMQWEKIAIPNSYTDMLRPPVLGTLPYEVSLPLRRLLVSSSDYCCFAIWRGWNDTYAPDVPATVSVSDEGHNRDYDLYIGPTTMLDITFFTYSSGQTANIFWSLDRRWWLATDIDLNTSYIGGEKQMIDSILACRELEAWPVLPTDDISEFADKIN